MTDAPTREAPAALTAAVDPHPHETVRPERGGLRTRVRRRLLRRGRPALYTAYGQDTALANTGPKRLGLLALLLVAVVVPFTIEDSVLLILALGFAAAIGAIGLNLVLGYAGQISLGHAFFLGLGALTAAVLGGPADGLTVGYELPMQVWLPAAGVVAAVAGLLVGPIATRLRGLYLAIVTVGLVLLGEHLFREADSFTGGFNVGRSAPPLELFGYSFDANIQQQYLLALALLVLFAVAGRNIARSKIGRAFGAIRDRDIAAGVIGVNLTRYKTIAFVISSFYAGVAGALFYSLVGYVEPSQFGLLLSIQYIAMVVIGGTATISGSIMGALFIIGLERALGEVSGLIPFISQTSSYQLEAASYGLLIVLFLLFEERGLYGIWVRGRNYFHSWPFSY